MIRLNYNVSVVFMISDDWCVAVFRCKPDIVENVLVDFYNFVRDLEGVKDLHFIIRDRVEDDVIFSFRVFIDPKYVGIIESKLTYKLKNFISEDRFAINPSVENPLFKYVAWSARDRISALFCHQRSSAAHHDPPLGSSAVTYPPTTMKYNKTKDVLHIMQSLAT